MLRDQNKGIRPRFWVWGVALFGLLLNDHLLKGAGWLSGTWTGKLSDFFGLIVAPALISASVQAALPLRMRGRSRLSWVLPLLSVGLVGLSFAAINLSSPISDLLCDALAMIGVSWRLWPDSSDLVALLVLPAAYWVAYDPWDRGPSDFGHFPSLAGEFISKRGTSRTAGWMRFALMGLSAWGCIATSKVGGPAQEVRVLVANDTDGAVVIQLSVGKGDVSCEGPTIEDAVLRSEDFRLLGTIPLEPGDVRRLDQLDEEELIDIGYEDSASPDSDCRPLRVALLRGKSPVASMVVGLTETTRGFDRSVWNLNDLGQNDDNVITVRKQDGALELRLGAHLYSIVLDDETYVSPSGRCARSSERSFLEGEEGTITVAQVAPISDRCINYLSGDVALSAGYGGQGGGAGLGGQGGDSSGTSLVFELPDLIQLCSEQELDVKEGDRLSLTKTDFDGDLGALSLRRLSKNGSPLLGLGQLSASEPLSGCGQVRDPCGGVYVRGEVPEGLEDLVYDAVVEEDSWITVVGRDECALGLQVPGGVTYFREVFE